MDKEYILIDKSGDVFLYKNLAEIEKELNLSKSQVYNVLRQSQQHYNKYTSRGVYIQKTYTGNPSYNKIANIKFDKYLYYEDDDGKKEWGVSPKNLFV